MPNDNHCASLPNWNAYSSKKSDSEVVARINFFLSSIFDVTYKEIQACV